MAGTDAGGRQSGQYVQVQTTTDSRVEAMELARAAVEARLAACGQVAGPVASTYWWNDEIERAEEWLVFFKLPADRYEALAAFLAERHSYDEPEIVATPIVAGSASFLDWMSEETRLGETDIPRQRESSVPAPSDVVPGGMVLAGRSQSPACTPQVSPGGTFQLRTTGSSCSAPRVETVPVSSRNSRPQSGGSPR
jgi:periplasmic divalent cation tolerance protein